MLRITTEEEWLACENPLELYECIKDRKDNHSFRWLAVEWGGYIRELYEEDNRKWFDAFASYVAERELHPSEIYDAPIEYWQQHPSFEASSYANMCVRALFFDSMVLAAVCACEAIVLQTSTLKLQPEVYNHITREKLTDYPSFDPAWIEENRGEYEFVLERIENRIEREFCNQFRDVAGNPFRPVIVRPEWRTSTVEAIARTIRREWAFDRLPYLADALQDVGCDNDQLLDHCRGAGPHVRGCWAVELLSAE